MASVARASMTEVVQPGSSSVERPDYWWFAARTALLEAGLGHWLGGPRAAPGRRQRRRAERRVAARRPPAGVRRPRPAGAGPGSGWSARPPWRCPSPTPPSTWSRPSTSSSTASPRPSRSPSWPGCSARADGCSSPCRPTSGRGRTTTSGPVTTGATRGRGSWPPWRRPGCGSSGRRTPSRWCSRCSPPNGSCAGCAARPPTGCPPCPRVAERMLRGLCATEARLLARRDLPFGSSVLVAAVKP